MDKVTTNRPPGQITEITQSLDELAREGARRMIVAALEVEVEQYIEELRHLRDEHGHALAVRNGKAEPRTVTLGAGNIELQAPRVNDRRPDHRFTSEILPPYMRRSPRLSEALPVLYLRGLSTGDFEEAIPALLGADAAGFSSSTITRLSRVWQDEYEGWRKRPLAGKEYVYVWADGVYFDVRLGEDKQLACLVLVGVLPDGSKEVIALEDGYRESTESWLSLLRDLERRGMPAPKVATGDGALGFWGALRQVFPRTEEQRCWVHKNANVLDKLPKRVQPRAKDMLHEIMYAPNRQSALEDIERFSQEFAAKYPKAVECLIKDQDELLTFFDFPAEHWLHLRTTNPIESSFSTVKARTKKTKGAGSRKAALAMAFKLLLAAEKRWRKINAPHLVALVQAGIRFPDGQRQLALMDER
jgi:transposase-like protein